MRADTRFDHVRLIMVTTESDLSHIQRAMQAGANDYVTKPFTPETIESKLALQGLHPWKSAPPKQQAAISVAQPAAVPSSGGSAKIRVMIVDDSVVVRGVVRKIVDSDPELEVADVATDGRNALGKLERARPDVVLLDIEMPQMDGFETLREIQRLQPRLPVIMFSSLTERGASATVRALTLGAVDYVHKPGGSKMNDPAAARSTIEDELLPKLKRHARSVSGLPTTAPTKQPRVRSGAEQNAKVEIVAIATSTGGPNALATLLPEFVSTCPVPIVIVQHMPPVFTQHLATRLSEICGSAVREAQQRDPVTPGQVLIAPGGYHLCVVRHGGRVVCRMNQDPPENACRPSADVLFRSVADTFGAGTLAVVLTGMGQDGLRGAEKIVENGGQVLAQDEASSVVWGMPGHVARNGLAAAVLPLDKISAEIKRRIQRKR